MTDYEQSHALRPAGFWSRAVAIVTDVVIVTILIGGYILLADLLERTFERASPFELDLRQLAAVTAPIIAFAYYVGFWSLGGRTPGKFVMGLRVVANDGSRISIWWSIVRYFGYFLSLILFGAGFLWVLVDRRRKAWHDYLARSHVVYDRSRVRAAQ